MPEAQGVMNLCLPAVVLNTILRQADCGAGTRPRRRSVEVRTRMRELVGEATVGTVLQFPTGAAECSGDCGAACGHGGAAAGAAACGGGA